MKSWIKGGLIGIAVILAYSVYFWTAYDYPSDTGTSVFLVSMPDDILMYHAISARDSFKLLNPPDYTDILIMTIFSICMYFLLGAIIGLIAGFVVNKLKKEQITEEGFSWLLLTALVLCYIWGFVSPQSAIFIFIGFAVGSFFTFHINKNKK